MISIALSFIAASLAVGEIRPPFKKAWNYEPSSYAGNMSALGSLIYFGNWDEYGVLNAKTGVKVWTKPVPNDMGEANVYLTPKGLLVAGGSESKGFLNLVSPDTGKLIFSLPRKGYPGPFAFSGANVYGISESDYLVCYDLNLRKSVWQVRIVPPRAKDEGGWGDGVVSLAAAGSVTACSFWKGTVEGRSARTGNLLWRRKEDKVRWWMLTANANVVLLGASNRPLTALRPIDGKVLWTCPSAVDPNSAGIIGDRILVPTSKNELFAVDLKSGRVLGSTKTKSACSYPLDQAPVVNGILYTRAGDEVLAITPKPAIKWSYKIEDDGAPVYVDGNRIVLTNMDTRVGDVNSSGGSNLTCAYVMGNPPALPTSGEARKALANRYVRDYAKLNVDQRRELEKLGRDAFEPLLTEVIRLGDAYTKALKDQTGNSYPIYSALSDLSQLLSPITIPSDTDRLLGLIKDRKAGDTFRGTVLGLLAQRGDRQKLVPYFIEALSEKVPSFILYESEVGYALNVIGDSSDPRVIDFLIKKLEDPDAEYTVRKLAYSNLGRTGGDRGKQAILAEKKRTQKMQLDPLVKRMNLGNASSNPRSSPQILNTRKAPDGTEWALITSDVLGGNRDLWIVQKQDGQWTSPVFTGINPDTVSGFVKPKPPETKFKGFTPKQLIDGKWFEAFVGDELLTKDSDRDGLSDIAESRLQTNPNKSDTDDDGIEDQFDLWPTVGRKAETDEEKALEAAFEARYHFGSWDGVAVIDFPSDVKPFEMIGRKSPTLVDNKSDWTHPIRQLYERGGILLGIRTRNEKDKGFAQMLTWNADKTQATVNISSYSGGLSGDGYVIVVQKYGSDWIVVSMGMAYIS